MFEYQPKNHNHAISQVLSEDRILLECIKQYKLRGVECWAIFLHLLGWWSSSLDDLRAKVNREFSTYRSLVTDCCSYVIGKLDQCQKHEHPEIFIEAILSFLGGKGFEYKEDASFFDLFSENPSFRARTCINCRTISLFALDVYSEVAEELCSTTNQDDDSFFNPSTVCGVVFSLNHQFNFFGKYLVDILALSVETIEGSSPVSELAPFSAVPTDKIHLMAFQEASHYYRGRYGNYEEALKIIQRARQIYPTYPILHLQEGWLLQNLQRLDDAISTFSEGYNLLLSEEPLRHDIENLRGAFEIQIAEVFYQLENYGEALYWIERAESRDSITIVRKALPLKLEILRGLGKTKEASDLQNALKLLGLETKGEENRIIIEL
jgi:tetratricopeptide (TPR) repeat protein